MYFWFLAFLSIRPKDTGSNPFSGIMPQFLSGFESAQPSPTPWNVVIRNWSWKIPLSPSGRCNQNEFNADAKVEVNVWLLNMGESQRLPYSVSVTFSWLIVDHIPMYSHNEFHQRIRLDQGGVRYWFLKQQVAAYLTCIACHEANPVSSQLPTLLGCSQFEFEIQVFRTSLFVLAGVLVGPQGILEPKSSADLRPFQ